MLAGSASGFEVCWYGVRLWGCVPCGLFCLSVDRGHARVNVRVVCFGRGRSHVPVLVGCSEFGRGRACGRGCCGYGWWMMTPSVVCAVVHCVYRC